MRLIKRPKRFLRSAKPASSPQIDKKFHLRPSLDPDALIRQFSAKAEAIKKLREEYEASPKEWEGSSFRKSRLRRRAIPLPTGEAPPVR